MAKHALNLFSPCIKVANYHNISLFWLVFLLITPNIVCYAFEVCSQKHWLQRGFFLPSHVTFAYANVTRLLGIHFFLPTIPSQTGEENGGCVSQITASWTKMFNAPHRQLHPDLILATIHLHVVFYQKWWLLAADFTAVLLFTFTFAGGSSNVRSMYLSHRLFGSRALIWIKK